MFDAQSLAMNVPPDDGRERQTPMSKLMVWKV